MLMTIGYEGLSTARFFELLRHHHVKRLVDVRELPLSRKTGFSKRALAARAQEEGIRYTHLREMGCPREIRHAYRDDGDWARYTERFLSYLDAQTLGLSDLAALIQQERCCLMCFEADYRFCHRSYVAQRLQQRLPHLRVIHLPATTEPAVRPLGAVVVADRPAPR